MTDENSEPRRRERERAGAAPSVRTEHSRDAAPARDASSIPQPADVPGKLSMELVPNPNNDSSPTFDWRAVDIDSNRSFSCTIASRLGHRLTVEILHGL